MFEYLYNCYIQSFKFYTFLHNNNNSNNTVYTIKKKENFYVHSNNKVSIAIESREVLLDPSLFPDHCP